MNIKIPASVPESEFSEEFIQGMADRLSMSYFKYGLMAKAYPKLVNALASLQRRLDMYERTGNTEFLIDAANFALIEFKHPSIHGAEYRPTDGKGPGRIWNGEVDASERSNEL